PGGKCAAAARDAGRPAGGDPAGRAVRWRGSPATRRRAAGRGQTLGEPPAASARRRSMSADTPRERPLDRLRVLAKQDVMVTPGLRHIEAYTLEGLLTFLWHGDPGCERVVVMCGGAIGGLLGPGNGLYHALGETFAAEGIGTIRVGYRRPTDLPPCVPDVAAATDLAHRNGGRPRGRPARSLRRGAAGAAPRG